MINTRSTRMIVTVLLMALSLNAVGCSKEKIEKSLGNLTTAVKSAREVTTVQHKYGHITDEQYVERLEKFKAAYKAIDTLGDNIVQFGTIDEASRPTFLQNVRDLNKTLVALIQTGEYGVKNPVSKAEYTRWILLASGTASAIEVAIAASKTPVDVKGVKVEKMN